MIKTKKAVIALALALLGSLTTHAQEQKPLNKIELAELATACLRFPAGVMANHYYDSNMPTLAASTVRIANSGLSLYNHQTDSNTRMAYTIAWLTQDILTAIESLGIWVSGEKISKTVSLEPAVIKHFRTLCLPALEASLSSYLAYNKDKTAEGIKKRVQVTSLLSLCRTVDTFLNSSSETLHKKLMVIAMLVHTAQSHSHYR